ncbi:cobalamin-binding protein [Meiothermus sp.]|jgi:iron complex transport system substrate-binding protein|uniref:cobalamin-binding protein n=1 Tax=Meiothermus sp. TaxID=1955249 RepID=UPI0021DEFF83|nr:cobalamin-binding protein [Meiothermus sp.]GIW24757.1 MAG: cobalamin-binding protein [Meiothermus sp.]
MRLVSLTCSNTEIVWALGALDWLVGVDSNSDFPPEVAQIPRVGPDLQIDLDKVEALRPDLVLASLSVPGMERVVEGLKKRRMPHRVLDPQTLQDVYADIERVARWLGVEQQGRYVVQAMQQQIAQARGSLPRWVRPPRVMVEWWPRPMIAAGRDSWVTQMLEALGAQNAFAHLPVRSKPLTQAEVEEAQPDLITVSWCGAKKLRPEVVLRRALNVPALRHGQVFALEEAYLGRPGPRLAEGVKKLAELLRNVPVWQYGASP